MQRALLPERLSKSCPSFFFLQTNLEIKLTFFEESKKTHFGRQTKKFHAFSIMPDFIFVPNYQPIYVHTYIYPGRTRSQVP
jgi:hypothetical protein